VVTILLAVLGVGLGISLGIVGYPILILTLARRENERASSDADRTWARTVVSRHPLLERAPPPPELPTATIGP